MDIKIRYYKCLKAMEDRPFIHGKTYKNIPSEGSLNLRNTLKTSIEAYYVKEDYKFSITLG